MFYGSNLHRKDNPRWVISNATATPKVPEAALGLLRPAGSPWDHPVAGPGSNIAGSAVRWAQSVCGICVSWLIGLPRRAGARLHAVNDAEARWWRWHVTEHWGGLVHQYRDARFASLRHDPAPPGCPRPGDR